VWRITAFDRDGREVGCFELTSGELTIGRENDRHLVLPSASVSRRHARIVAGAGQPVVVDEGSSNGVLVNGQRIAQPTAVGPGVRIDIAEFRIAVEPSGVLPAPSAPSFGVPPPVVPSSPFSSPASFPAPSPAVPPAAMAGAMVAAPSVGLRLVGEGGPFDGRVFELRPGPNSVGRALDNDLVFEDPSLSRKHARLVLTGDQLEVEDLGSSNGTLVNGRRVDRATLGVGDALRFGDLVFRVEGDATGPVHGVPGGGAQPHPESPQKLYALVGGGALTCVLLVLAVIFLVRKVPAVQASGTIGIAKVAREAEQHLERGQKLFKERKYTEATVEIDAAYELDPGNPDIRKLKLLASHATEDDRYYQNALGMLRLGDRKEIERALRNYELMTDGAPQREQLATKLGQKLVLLGAEQCGRHQWGDCAWAICRALQVAPGDVKTDEKAVRMLHDAEKRLGKRYTRCSVAVD
jgi:pSer/pThr/pTyr-binding forkhead associated (FHA) protein